MAPLYQHFNKQKIVTPAEVINTNYTVFQNTGTTFLTTQADNTLRVQAGELSAGIYLNNAWIRSNNLIPSGAKSITILFKFNAGGQNGFGICLGDENVNRVASFLLWGTGVNRVIPWYLMSPNNAPTSYYSWSINDDISWSMVTNTVLGLRINDTGTGLNYQHSYNGGSTWSTASRSRTYVGAGLAQSPVRFGLITHPSTSGSALDVTLISATIA